MGVLKDMVKGKQNGKMAQYTRVNGKKICKTVKESKLRKMDRIIKGNSTMAKSKDMGSIAGQTVAYTKANGTMTKYMEPVLSNQPTIENMLVLGRKIKCMVEAYLLGQMEGNIAANTLTTKNKAPANILGHAENITKVSGLTDSSMVLEFLKMLKVKARKVFGKRGS